MIAAAWMESAMSNENTTVKYSLIIEFNEKWVEGMGIDGLIQHIRARIELALGSYPHDRGKVKRFQRIK